MKPPQNDFGPPSLADHTLIISPKNAADTVTDPQTGIIHRDLRPANILVNDSGEPKILDFGVARATDVDIQITTLRTSVGQLIGTIPYMSPEQAVGDPADLDTRSDIYALGVITYELLAGHLPYEVSKKMIHEAVRIIREDEPAALSSVNKMFRGDIEIIVGRALEKERIRRYQSVSDFAADIRRYLHDEPIVARPTGHWYRAAKFARRNRALVGGIVAVFIVLTAGIVGTSVGMIQAIKARKSESAQRILAEQQHKEAETQAAIAKAVNRFLNNDLLATVAPEELGRAVTVRQVLDAASGAIESKLADQPLVAAAVHHTLGATYMSLGEYARAEAHLKKALDIRHRAIGEENVDSLVTMNNLATALHKQDKFKEAETLYSKVLEIRRRVLGLANEDTLVSMNNLAALYQVRKRYDKAEPLLDQTLVLRRRVLGEEHPDTLATMHALAALYLDQERYEAAEELCLSTLILQKRILGAHHPSTLGMMHNLAEAYANQNRKGEAEHLYRKVLEAQNRLLGESHPDTKSTLEDLCDLLRSQENHAEHDALHCELPGDH